MSPSSRARATASAREVVPRRRLIAFTCVLTVFGDRYSSDRDRAQGRWPGEQAEDPDLGLGRHVALRHGALEADVQAALHLVQQDRNGSLRPGTRHRIRRASRASSRARSRSPLAATTGARHRSVYARGMVSAGAPQIPERQLQEGLSLPGSALPSDGHTARELRRHCHPASG